jgi:hypothetical protein
MGLPKSVIVVIQGTGSRGQHFQPTKKVDFDGDSQSGRGKLLISAEGDTNFLFSRLPQHGKSLQCGS